MAGTHLLLLSTLIATSAAQGDLFSSLLSDAQSIYTVVTSVLAATTASTTSTSDSSSTSSTSSSTSTTSSTSASPTSSPSSTPSSTANSAAILPTAANAASGSGSDGGGSNNTLAIVLGCTLGAIAIAALLGLLYLCLRRRKRSKHSAKHRPLSPDDGEIESWKHEKPRVQSFKGPEAHITRTDTSASAAPLMAERNSDMYGYHPHQNPFVPVPPPARQPGFRAGLQDTSYSAHPYSPEHINNYQPHGDGGMHHDNQGHHAFAAGLGGAALGGFATHNRDRHERQRSASRGRETNAEHSYSEDDQKTLPQVNAHDRRSGSLARASASEPWPYMDTNGRQSMDSARSRARSSIRSQEHFSTPNQHPVSFYDMATYPRFAGASAVGGLAGVAAARTARSRSPHRKGILKQTTSNSSDPSSLSNSSRSTPYVTNLENRDAGPHELDSTDVPTTPNTRARRDSTLGTAAPLAAATAVAGEYRPRSAGRSRKPHNRPTSLTLPPLEPPRIPSRSPKRPSLDYRGARYSSVNEGTAELPVNKPKQEPVSPSLEPQDVGATDRDGLISPVSPITSSQPGTWSRAQAEELGMSQPRMPVGPKTRTQDTISSGHDHNSTENTSSEPSLDQQSSGLVSAIQRIFSSQKTAWADNENDDVPYGRPRNAQGFQPVSSDEDENYGGNQAGSHFMSTTRRKPTPTRHSLQNAIHSQYGNIDSATTGAHGTAVSAQDSGPGRMAPQQPQQAQSFENFRKSIESAHSLPPTYRTRENSFAASNPDLSSTISTNDFAPTVASAKPPSTNLQNTARPRATSRPAYGQGSGDPFDLARTRTDSSMTGISLSNYRSHDSSPAPAPAPAPAPTPAITSNHSRPWPQRTSSGEPTLADLRREVQQEDRERARRSSQAKTRSRGLSSSSGGGVPGLRYGDDKSLFDLVDQSIGRRSGSGEYDRFYGQDDGAHTHAQNKKRVQVA